VTSADRRALEERIALVRKEVAQVRKERGARREAKKLVEIEELGERVRAAKERLRELSTQRTSSARRGPTEGSLRANLYGAGGVVSALGLVLLYGMYAGGALAQGDLPDRIQFVGISSIPLLLGLGLLARARFAKYRPDKDDLDGDFL